MVCYSHQEEHTEQFADMWIDILIWIHSVSKRTRITSLTDMNGTISNQVEEEMGFEPLLNHKSPIRQRPRMIVRKHQNVFSEIECMPISFFLSN